MQATGELESRSKGIINRAWAVIGVLDEMLHPLFTGWNSIEGRMKHDRMQEVPDAYLPLARDVAQIKRGSDPIHNQYEELIVAEEDFQVDLAGQATSAGQRRNRPVWQG